jgi:hypothetical protein
MSNSSILSPPLDLPIPGYCMSLCLKPSAWNLTVYYNDCLMRYNLNTHGRSTSMRVDVVLEEVTGGEGC